MFKHKQRLTVLLIFLCVAYFIFYFTQYLLSNIAYILDVELLTAFGRLLSFGFIFDKIRLRFSFLVIFISTCVFFFSRTYINRDPYYYRFIWILLSFVLSINILILSGSFLTLLVGWDGLGVSSFALIIYYQSKESWTAGFLTLLINRLGDIVIIRMLFFFALRGRTLLVNYYIDYQEYLLLLLAVAALTKSAQYPFSVWLPAAIAAPTPVSALVHSSTLVTAGVYIIIRRLSTINLPGDVSILLLFCGSVTSFLGGLCAVLENDLKKIIALSTLSQLGVIMFRLGLGANHLALLHLYTHAMFKALLFLVAGAILIIAFGTQDIRLLGAVTRKAPVLLIFINISSFCLIGLPFLSSFYSKHVILSLIWSSAPNILVVVLILLRTGLTGFYIVRLLKCLNWTRTISSLNQPSIDIILYLPLCFLFLGSLLSGIFFYTVEINLPIRVYFPATNELLLTVVVILGVLLGYLYSNRRARWLLSDIFFLRVLWYHSPFLLYTFSKNVKWLDQGWLEPNSSKDIFTKRSQLLYSSRSWPLSTFSFLSFRVICRGVYILVWVFLK